MTLPARLLRALLRVRRDQGAPSPWERLRDWLRGAWLTARYVDSWGRFPAILPVKGGRVQIVKRPGSRLTVVGQVFVQGTFYSPLPSVLLLEADSHLDIRGNMVLGDNNRIKLARGARLEMGGSSGTARFHLNSSSVIAAERDLRIGPGSIIGHYCLVTDSDWHPIGKGEQVMPTSLGKETWLFDGAKVLKGVTLGDGCAVTSNAVVLPGTYPPRSLLAGMPAAVKLTGLEKGNE